MADIRILVLILLGLVDSITSDESLETEKNPSDVFNGVYSECLLEFSFSCLQRRTLLYLKELDKIREIPVLGDYVKFVKLNTSEAENETSISEDEDLTHLIDKAIDKFFDSRLLRFKALGRDVMVPDTVEEFVGRKKRKGGGGGGGGGHGGDDGGKKKMMMMAMMCMKMKFMMMVPAMMGMMGMMSFKTMMFSMMSFMMAKMMLLMKILEKKGGGGGSGGWNTGGGDAGWAAGGGGGAWMPAGQDYGGGYDANGQWQSRSLIEAEEKSKPVITYVKPIVRYSKIKESKPSITIKNLRDESKDKESRSKRGLEAVNINVDTEKNISDSTKETLENIEKETIEGNKRSILHKNRQRRSILDDLHRAYLYWANKVLGIGNKKPVPKYRIVNGVKYVYQPVMQFKKIKTPKELNNNEIKQANVEFNKGEMYNEEFNKGEIVEVSRGTGTADGRTIKKMRNKVSNVSDTVEENPWE